MTQMISKAKEQERIAQIKAKKQARKAAEAEKDRQRQKEAAEMAALIPQLGRMEQEAFAPLLLKENLEIFSVHCIFKFC